ncbi:MAG: divergent polysaccharide deacetylase family protein [Alphaproteobacteria bacterium]
MLNGPVTYARRLSPPPEPAPAPRPAPPRAAVLPVVILAVSVLISAFPDQPAAPGPQAQQPAPQIQPSAPAGPGVVAHVQDTWYPLVELADPESLDPVAPAAAAARPQAPAPQGTGPVGAVPPHGLRAPHPVLEDRHRARLRLVAQALVRQTRTVRVAAGIAPSLKAVIETAAREPEEKSVPVPVPQPRTPNAPDWRAFGSVAMPIPRGDPATPQIALVIDDLGLNAGRTRAVMALPGRLTMAFLPYGRHSRRLARAASEAGHEIMLHLPMEPLGPEDPGPKALLEALPTHEFMARILWAFDQIEGFVGFNNHMGSRLTENAQAMARLMDLVKDRDLYFLDSLTSARSVAYEAALDAGLPTLVRQVFLDHDASPAAIRERLDETLERARRRGAVIAIGHPYDTTLAALRDWIPKAQSLGLSFVPVSAFLAPDTQRRLLLAARMTASAVR